MVVVADLSPDGWVCKCPAGTTYCSPWAGRCTPNDVMATQMWVWDMSTNILVYTYALLQYCVPDKEERHHRDHIVGNT